MDSPSPVPPKRRAVEPSACVNGWNSFALRRRGKPDAGVLHAESHALAAFADTRFPHHPQHDRTRRGELDGVAQQVEQHLAEPDRVAAQTLRQYGVHVGQQRQSLLPGAAQQEAGPALNEVQQTEGHTLQGQLAGLDLGEIEDVVDHGQQARPAVLHRAHEIVLFRVQRRLGQQVGHADDAVERGADLMATCWPGTRSWPGRRRGLAPGRAPGLPAHACAR